MKKTVRVAKSAALYVIRWRCLVCGAQGRTPEVRQSAPWSDIERVLMRLHRERAPRCQALAGDFELEYSLLCNREKPPIARPA